MNHVPQGSPFVLPMMELILASSPEKISADADLVAQWIKENSPQPPENAVNVFMHPNTNRRDPVLTWRDHFGSFPAKLIVDGATLARSGPSRDGAPAVSELPLVVRDRACACHNEL